MSASITIRKYGYLTLIIILAIAGSFGVYRFGNNLFDIRNIEVVGSEVKVEIDERRIAKNLFFFPGDKLRDQILNDNPLIQNVTFKKQFPHTLVIVVDLRKPIALVRTPSGIMGIDKTGVLLAGSENEKTLPKLQFELPEAVAGQKVPDRKILESLDFISFTQNFITLESVEASGAAILAKSSKINIIIAQNANMRETATTLQTLLVGFRIKGTLPAIIDLRFDKPIVKF